MRLHPAIVVIALMTGAKLGGIIGVLLALPATAVGKAVLRNWRKGSPSPETAQEIRGEQA
jgi:predicted PurR-regulated permease PerM